MNLILAAAPQWLNTPWSIHPPVSGENDTTGGCLRALPVYLASSKLCERRCRDFHQNEAQFRQTAEIKNVKMCNFLLENFATRCSFRKSNVVSRGFSSLSLSLWLAQTETQTCAPLAGIMSQLGEVSPYMTTAGPGNAIQLSGLRYTQCDGEAYMPTARYVML